MRHHDISRLFRSRVAGRIQIGILAAAIGWALAGCGGGGESSSSGEGAETTRQGEQTTEVASGQISGTIVETMDAGGYTYARIETASGSVWTAGPVTAVTVGTHVDLPANMKMPNFHSESLERTFETIYFVPSFGGAAGGSDPHEELRRIHGGRDVLGGAAPGGEGEKHTAVEKEVIGDVEPLAGGHTVSQVYASRQDLAGKTVKIRGIVVKFTPSIMGRNWVHIQDGTCEGELCDVTATTTAVVATGDLVIVEGMLAVDKDFGAGYRYEAIIESASVTKE